MIEINPESNYIRNHSLTWNSFEIYALMFLLFMFFRVLIMHKEKNIDRRLIHMYLLSVVFAGSNYRIVSMQISELVIILIAMYDIYRHKFGIVLNSLTVFMLTSALIFIVSDVIAMLQGMYTESPYSGNAVLSYTAGNIIRFLLIVYVVSKIIREYREKDDIFDLMDLIRLGGEICACVTILQVVLYAAGFRVAGVFYFWGIPRPKGLSHEPATNAFVLLMPMLLSVFYVYKGRYKIHVKSLILQMTAFLFCFSTGAIPVFLAALLIFLFKSQRKIEPRRRFAVNMKLLFGLLVIIFVLCNVDITAFINLVNKFLSIFNDYAEKTSVSGRGGDMLVFELVVKNNFMFGIGAFNSIHVFEASASVTNMYIVFFCELGFIGMTFFILVSLLFVRNYSVRLKKIKNSPYYSNIFAFSVASIIMLAWLRVFNFHQIWLVFSLAYLQQNPPCHLRQGG